MKKHLLLWIFLLFLPGLNHVCIASSDRLTSLLKTLDEMIENEKAYVDIKKLSIEGLKNSVKNNDLPKENIYHINKSLFLEYKSYLSDSAILYLNKNLDIAYDLNDSLKINETVLDCATLYSSLGLFKESLDILEKLNWKKLDKEKRILYYLCLRSIYGGIAQYTLDNRGKSNYWRQHSLYTDSALITIGNPKHPEYMRIEETRLREDGKLDDAIKINDKRLQEVKEFSPQYATIMFHRSLLFRKKGDTVNEKICLALSSISDVQSAIKDNASISILANILYREGDINRAYQYMSFALTNASIYNTRLRSSDLVNVQTIIEKTYHEKSEKQKHNLHKYLILISMLSLFLVISAFFIYKQMKKREVINKRIKEANSHLGILNKQLLDVNSQLEKTNSIAREANHIKEEYIGYFLNTCLEYIDKIDNYRKMVNKKLQERQYEDLFRTTKSASLKEDELKELFINFDTMFVHLFPNFVDKFNDLLVDDAKMILKKGEILNTELRIYALIRLGIQDSVKISNFLGYSVNTIYNYRTKIKNKANIPREDFEWTVKQIGVFYKG